MDWGEITSYEREKARQRQREKTKKQLSSSVLSWPRRPGDQTLFVVCDEGHRNTYWTLLREYERMRRMLLLTLSKYTSGSGKESSKIWISVIWSSFIEVKEAKLQRTNRIDELILVGGCYTCTKWMKGLVMVGRTGYIERNAAETSFLFLQSVIPHAAATDQRLDFECCSMVLSWDGRAYI